MRTARPWPLAVVAVVIASVTAVGLGPTPSAASTPGPVLVDTTDTGYHGSVRYDPGARTRTLQSGWAYLARWYDLLTAKVPAGYGHNGRIAVLGATGLDNDLDDDFVADDPFIASAHCGVATYEIARSRGFDIDWYDGSSAIDSFLDQVTSGVVKPRMIHIVEHTAAADVGQVGELCRGGLDDDEAATLASNASALGIHVNRGGALFSNDQPYGWLNVLYPAVDVVSCGGSNGAFTARGTAAFPAAAAIDAQAPYHRCFTVGSSTSPLEILIAEGSDVIGLGGASVSVPGVIDPSSPTASNPPNSPVAGPVTGGTGGSGPIGGGPSTSTTVAPCASPCVERHGGVDRYATAALTARSAWSATGTRAGVVALGSNYPDAIVAGPFAALLDSPVFLVTGRSVPDATLDAMRDLGVQRVYLMGGTAAIAEEVAADLAEEGMTVRRLGGVDRYSTSAIVARRWSELATSVIYVARGDVFTDQLVAAHLAAHAGVPLLLVRPDGSVDDAVRAQIERLAPASIVVVGVRLASLAPLDEIRDGDAISRVTAADPYALSAAAVGRLGDVAGRDVLLVTGEDFPDALAGVPLAARRGIAMVLTRSDCLPSSVFDSLDRIDPSDLTVLGGVEAVSSDVTGLATICR